MIGAFVLLNAKLGKQTANFVPGFAAGCHLLPSGKVCVEFQINPETPPTNCYFYICKAGVAPAEQGGLCGTFISGGTPYWVWSNCVVAIRV